MTIQNISSTNTYSNVKNIGVIQPSTPSTLPSNGDYNNPLLTPEQKNTLQDDFNAKLAEQASNIKSNFQTAKDIDLTRAYYEQQQKLVDIYMQAGTTNDSNNTSSISVTKSLTDAYSSLYQLHQSIKEGVQSLPKEINTGETEVNAPQVLPVHTDKQHKTYNNFMMPTTNSYLSLHA
jgi:hypothetical protein